MASQTQGIQQLLAAEKRAAEKVAEAKKSLLIYFRSIVASNPQPWNLNLSAPWKTPCVESTYEKRVSYPNIQKYGKARRLKQAKEEAQDEIERYKQDRERQFKEFEAQHMGSREDVAARIDADTRQRIEEMTKAVNVNKEQVIQRILELVYDIRPEMHKNYRPTL